MSQPFRLVPLGLALGLAVGGCASRQPLPPRVPAREAAWFKFPPSLEASRQTTVPARVAAAIQLALEDFRPLEPKASESADPVEACLAQRESFDVQAAPWRDDVVLVRFSVSPGACIEQGPVTDMGATYAVEPGRGRIVAVQHP